MELCHLFSRLMATSKITICIQACVLSLPSKSRQNIGKFFQVEKDYCMPGIRTDLVNGKHRGLSTS